MALNAPAQLTIETLMRTRPGYLGEHGSDLWRLYAGGQAFDPARFIRQRRSEPGELYQERLARTFYCGYIGEIVDSFVANLFLKEPRFRVEGRDSLPDYYNELALDCNGAGTDLNAFHRDRWTQALALGESFIWVDLPTLDGGVLEAMGAKPTRGALDRVGARNAYLVPVNSSELLDWDRDEQGRLLWVLLHHTRTRRESFASGDRDRRHTWTVLDRDGFAVYEAREKLKLEGGVWTSAEETFNRGSASLAAAGDHPFQCVPIVELRLPAALSIGEKLFDMQRALTELDNAISWQQLMSLFAMPVVKTAKDFAQTMGESYYIKLDPEDEFGYAEPAGTAIQTSMERRGQIQEEMFRIAHQMAQAIKSEAQTAGRSGESKRRDQNPTQVVLTYLGSIARDCQFEILKMVARGRQEDFEFSVDGFDDFDVEELGTFLENQTQASTLRIHSPTFHRENEKRIVRKMHPDLPPEVQSKIDAEIESAEIPMPGDELSEFGQGDEDEGSEEDED